jgi:hypothetical protein
MGLDDSILRLLTAGGATTSVIVVVVLFLRSLKEMREEVRAERAAERGDFRESLDRITSAHEKVTSQITERVERVSIGVGETKSSVDKLRERFDEHLRNGR